jgi:DNA-binding MarR family transcriptional regulator
MIAMSEKPVVSDEEWAVWRAFLDVRGRLDVRLERQLQNDAALSNAEFGVLVSLFEAPDKQLRVGELGATLAWEKSRVSHQVSRMERRGLVERRLCSTDGRGTWVHLTPEGSRALLRATRPHAALLRETFFDVLSPEQLAALGEISHTLLGALTPCAAEDLEERPADAVA